jgi:hypothetical protein
VAQLSTDFYELTKKLREKHYEVQAHTEGKWIYITVRDMDGQEYPFESDKPQDVAYPEFVAGLKEVFDFSDDEIDYIEFINQFDRRAATQEAKRAADPTWNPAVPERAAREAAEVVKNTTQRSEIVVLTREMAREILWNHIQASKKRGYGLDPDLEALARGEESFFAQRKYSDRHGKNLMDAMEGLEWKLTHQGLGIARDGFLIDGQHRATGVAASGIPIPIVVTYNVDDSVFPVVDTGKGRTAGDVLTMLNIKDANQIATVIRLLYNYDTFRNPADWYSKSMSPERVRQTLIEKYINIGDSYAVARSLSQSKSARTYLSRSAMAAANYIITRAWPAAPIKEFWTNVQGGNIHPYWHDHYDVANYNFNPGHALHRWAQREDDKTKTQGQRRGAQTKNSQELIMILRAWNDINVYRVVQRYQWVKSDEAPRPYTP